MVAIRTLGAALFFGLLAYRQGWEPIRGDSDYARLLLCALLGVSLNQIFFFQGLAQTSPVNAAAIMTTSPLFVFLAALLIYRQSFTPVKVLGLMMAFAGAAGLSLKGGRLDLGSGTTLGDLMVMINAASYGTYLVVVGPLMRRYRVMTVVAWVFGLGALVNVPLGLPYLMAVPWAAVSAGSLWGAAYVLVFVTIGTYSLNGWALQRLPSSAVGVYIYLQPVIAAGVSLVWGAEVATWRQIALMGLVIIGVYVVTYRKKTAQTTG